MRAQLVKISKRKGEVVFERTPFGQLFYDIFFSRLSAKAVARKWRPQITVAEILMHRKHKLRRAALAPRETEGTK